MANSNTSPKKHAPTSKKGPTPTSTLPVLVASPSSTGSNTKGQPGNARGATTSTSNSTSNSTSTVSKKPRATTTSSETTLVISNQGKSDANRPVQKTFKVQEAEGPSKTDSERPREERQRRSFTFCMGVICCLILLLVLGLVLGLVVFGKDDNNNNNNNNNSLESSQSSNGGAPAPAPAGAGNNGGQTPSMPTPPQNNPVAPAPSSTTNNGNSSPIAPNPETSPVMSPTLPPSTPTPVAPVAPAPTSLLQPSPSQIIILPSADTFVYRNGFTPYEAYGTEDTFLVQNGPNGVNEIPDAVGLLGFDLSTGTGTLPSSYSQVVLQLYHQAASRNRGAATLTIRLLSSTPLAVETLHAGIFNPTDDEGTFGPTFTVSPSDTVVQVDITTLVRNQNQDEDQLFLMIENRGAEQGQGAEGDRFYTRETDDPPQLIVYI